MAHHVNNHKAACLLLCACLASGCASRPEPIAPELRQQLGKVYLYSSGATGETFFHASLSQGGAGGAVTGAMNGLDHCLDSALAAGALGVVVLAVCAPLVVPAGAIKGAGAGNHVEVAAETSAMLEQQANDALQEADLSPALVATLDALSQQDTRLEQYEISHGTLPLPEGSEPVHGVAARWGYQTVMEVEIIKAGFDSDDGVVPLMHLSMSAEVRLVEATTGKLLDEQEYSYNSTPQPVATWFDNNYRRLASELVQANKVIASDIIGNVFVR